MNKDKYRLETIYQQEKAFKHFSNYVIKRMNELKFGIEFASLVQQAKDIPKKPIQRISITDIDKILSVKGEIKAFFELKSPIYQQNNGEFIVNLSQFDTLRTLSRMTDVPVFYLIRYAPNTYRLIKCNYERAALVDKSKTRVRFLDNDGILLNRKQLIHCLADILYGNPIIKGTKHEGA